MPVPGGGVNPALASPRFLPFPPPLFDKKTLYPPPIHEIDEFPADGRELVVY